MTDFTETIHIFYACDDNFAKFTMVSIASLMENASKDFKYHIHIIFTWSERMEIYCGDVIIQKYC